MNSRLAIFCLALLSCTIALAQAQTPAIASPSRLKWIVEISSPAKSPNPNTPVVPELPTDPVREENAMSPGLRQEIRSFRDGSKVTRYAIGDLIVYFDPRTNRVEIDAANKFPYGGPLSLKGFSELLWVGPAFLDGQKTLDGVVCDVYRRDWPANPETENTSTRIARNTGRLMTAYINSETRLPVMLETPAEIRRYAFSPLPLPIALPAEYQDAIDQRAAAIKWRKQRFKNPDETAR